MTQAQKDLATTLVGMSEYEGVDKVLTSFDMKAIIAEQPKIIPTQSGLFQLAVGGKAFLSQ